MCQIHNDIFCLSVSTTGAELDELCIHDINILWKKNKVWNAQSPILFPVIGCLKDNYYIYKDNSYCMPSHGFIKNKEFQVVKHTDTMVQLVTYSDSETLKLYPFSFEFRVTYQLLNTSLKISFEVKNTGTEDMLFSVGFHPGFNYIGLQNILGKDIGVSFGKQEALSILFNPTYVIGMSKERLGGIKNLSDISDKLVKNRTLCYQGVPRVDLHSYRGTLRIQQDMPYLAFWQSEPENPKFLCIEAWDGLPDEENASNHLLEKHNLQSLKAKECYKSNIEISFIEKGAKNENN